MTRASPLRRGARALLGLVAAVATWGAAAPAEAAYINRYSAITNGAVTFTGNALGLNKASNVNSAGSVGSIGAFTTTNTALQVAGYPAGTTLQWAQNSSSAVLNIPAGSTVLYAELIWAGSYSYGGQNVSANLGSAVTFATPAGSFSISPAGATSQTLGTAGANGTCTTAPCFYVRSQNVTAQVAAAGAGTYTIAGVPATVGASENNSNTAGWTLAVAYSNAALPARNLTVFVGAETAGQAAATVSGFCTPPTGPRAGRLLVSALEGDPGIVGDQMAFGPTAASVTPLSGPNNLVGNFFSSQINGDTGARDTSGTFGGANQPNNAAATGRQGYDITNVDVSATLLNGQTSGAAQGITTGDQYAITALGLQINVGAPKFPVTTKTVNKASTFVGDTLTYTVALDNTTGTADATNVVFTDIVPPGTTFVANSLTVGGIVQLGANPAAGVNVGTIAAGASKTVSFQVNVASVPASPAVAQYANAATWAYQFVSCTGQAATSATLTTNPVITTVPRLEPTKAVSPAGSVYPGQVLTYTIAVPNTGTANTTATTLADAIPAGTTYVAGSTTLNGSAVADLLGTMPFAIAGLVNSPSRAAGQINAGETATVTFRVTVNAGAGGPITNTATIDADGLGPTPAQTAQVAANVARLVPTKTVSPVIAVAPGEVLTYTISVPNTGNGNSSGTTLADPIPAGTNYVAGSTTLNGGAVADAGAAMPFATAAPINSPGQPAGQIAAGATATVTFKVTVGNTPGAGAIVNVVTIDPDGPGSAPATTAQASSVVALPDLVLTKSHSGNFVVGATGSYTLQVANAAGAGQVTLGPIVLTDSLPNGLTVAAPPTGTNWDCSATVVGSTNASCVYNGGFPITPGATLPPVTLSVAVAAAAAPGVTNTAAVSAVLGETNTANNVSSDATTVLARPTVAKAFTPASIAAGTASTLTLTIANANGSPLTGVAVSDTFPAGLVVAAVPAATTTCGGSLAGATAGSGTVSLSGGLVAGNASCSVSIAVTAASGGSYANTAGGAASNETGAAGAPSNTAVLSVFSPPQIAKTFTPSTVGVGGVSTLLFTLTNPSPGTLNGVAFTDVYPAGLVNAAVSNLVSTCGGTATGGQPGGNAVGLTGATLAGGTSCTVRVDVTSAAAGSYANTSGVVTSTNGGAGNTASATLTVLLAPTVAKAFAPASIPAGGTSTLTLTISNPTATALTGVGLADAFPSGLQVAASPALANSCGGSVAGATAGSTSVTLSGGSVAATSSCSVSVAVTAAATGTYTNTAGGASSTQTGPAGANSNSAVLTVLTPPQIGKTFSINPVATAAPTVLTLTLRNTNPVALTGVAFNDAYPAGLVNTLVPGVANSCGGATTGGFALGGSIGLSGGTIPANGSCTVSVNVMSAVNGSYANTTGAVTSTNGGTGNTASATLVVAANPQISKAFAPTTIATGARSTLTISIANNSIVPLTGLAFSDTFPSGLVVDTTPSLANGCGGSVSGATAGSGTISLAGGVLAANSSCTITVGVTAAARGSYANTTGPITSTQTGAASGSNTAVLQVLQPASIAKSFNPTSILVNGISTLSIVITNPDSVPLTGVAFADNFPTNLRISALPTATNSCGGTLSGVTAGSTAFSLGGASLPAGPGTTCTVSVQVTSGVAGTLSNTATGVSSNETPTGTGSNAALLVVVAPDLRLAKTHAGSFTVGTNGSYTLQVDNTLGTGATAGTITVTDTLPAGLTYVAAGSGGTGWACSAAAQVVTCTSGTTLAAGAVATPITLVVAVGPTAVPAVTNHASVGGGGEPSVNAGNNSAADFTNVAATAQNAFQTDGQQTAAPGATVFYPHVFNAGVAGSVQFSTSAASAPPVAGWSEIVYRDANCNGVLDAAEATAPLTAAVGVAPGDTVCLVVKEFVPATAPHNAQNQLTVTATFTATTGGTVSVLARTDLTIVGAAGAGLTLQKSVRNVTSGGAVGASNTARPADVLEYTITFANNGAAALGNIVVNDATPAFTVFVAALCGTPLPASLTACTVTTQPAVAASGAIAWTLTGPLAPGAAGTVQFRVAVQ